jgi:hypothetical protein
MRIGSQETAHLWIFGARIRGDPDVRLVATLLAQLFGRPTGPLSFA